MGVSMPSFTMPLLEALSTGEKWTCVWLAANFYIHFGWEMSLLFWFDYRTWKNGFSKFNALVASFDSYGRYDRRYRLENPADYGDASIDKAVLAVEVPAGIIDGTLCVFWLHGLLNNTWYRYPTQLVVSALHAFGTIVFWCDELAPGWMNWMKGRGWKWTHTDGPRSIHWWWAFIGTNAVWVIIPALYMRGALNKMRPALEAYKF